jgi:hypothetical protein
MEFAAMLCKENEALPGIGGTYNCFDAKTSVTAGVNILPDLQTRPEFKILLEENKTITTSDLVALYINSTGQVLGAYDYEIQNNTEINGSRRFIQATFSVTDDAGTPLIPYDDSVSNRETSGYFVLSEDKNTGYVVIGPPIYNSITGGKTEDAAAMEEIFNSFESLT